VYGVVCKNRWALVRIKTSTRIPDDSRRSFTTFGKPQRWGAHPVAVLGLRLHVGTPLRCVAASTTETKTTPPLERVPRQCPVRGGEAVCLQTVGKNCTTVSLRSRR
ncbi:hypothetical protein TcG_13240, partial [Trypanosoma cruzi]